MLSAILKKRLVTFLAKSQPNFTFISKFLRKLRAERVVDYCEDVGVGSDESSFIYQIIHKGNPYRLTIRYKNKVYHCIEVLDLTDDSEFEIVTVQNSF